jgi:hypothetical protein
VNFEDLMNEDSDQESVLPDDSGCDSVISGDLEIPRFCLHALRLLFVHVLLF